MTNGSFLFCRLRALGVCAAVALFGCTANDAARGARTGGAGDALASGAGSGNTGGSSGSNAAGGTSTDGANSGDSGGAPDDAGPADDAVDEPDAPAPLSTGCAGGACLNPECQALGEQAPPGAFVSLGFEPQPAYIPNDVIVPTFDDVPDRPYTSSDGARFTSFGPGDWTRGLLDSIEANNLHFDFFINTSYRCDVDQVPGCGDTVTRILQSQNPGNMTVHHVHMGTNVYDAQNLFNSGCLPAGMGSMLACEDEITGVESTVGVLSNGRINHLTRFRAPYGEPFQTPGATTSDIQAVVAAFAVHVGWAIDSGDADHETDGKSLGAQFFVNNVAQAVGTGPGKGRWGILRMHGIYPWSLDEAKGLLDPKTGYLSAHEFRIGTVEDVVCWKYGHHSWELISEITGHSLDPN